MCKKLIINMCVLWKGTCAHVEHIDMKNPKASLISSPLCILKQITCEVILNYMISSKYYCFSL